MSFFRPARSVARLTPSALRTHLASPFPLPLRLPNLVDSWPATTQWTLSDGLDALREAVGEHREVEVELGKRGRGYLDPSWQRISMGFGLFLDAFILSLIPSSPDSGIPKMSGYLAQSDLLDTSPRLAEAVPPLPHFQMGQEGNLYRRTIWIGPEGSWTPFHKDPYHGIYSQIIGEKTFHLLPPAAAAHLSPSQIPRHANTSQIPLPISTIFPPSSLSPTTYLSGDATMHEHTMEDLSDLPPGTLDRSRSLLSHAFTFEGSCRVDLEPGDSVLIPQGWWHAAEGVGGAGVGVGAWFR